VVGPTLQRRGGQGRVGGNHRGELHDVAVVEHLAAGHLGHQVHPAGEAEAAGDGQLCRGRHDPRRHRLNPREGARVATFGGPQQLARLAAQLLEVGTGG
jgi:hypothetical protein